MGISIKDIEKINKLKINKKELAKYYSKFS